LRAESCGLVATGVHHLQIILAAWRPERDSDVVVDARPVECLVTDLRRAEAENSPDGRSANTQTFHAQLAQIWRF